jgi:hypothetical protein
MITAIVYGRNDSHGYNLHKRVAISLNCMAAVMDDPDDEIIFVDYNTPDDFITFPEAVADTLTDHCKKILRTLRVRPRVHALFADRTDIGVLEPVSRNIAIRRSNPKNRWLLLTNTDMVFRMEPPHKSMSAMAGELADGFYELPRFEIPDTMWNLVDRKNPEEIIKLFHEWGSRYHLDEVHEWFKETLYSEPGDFQLALRQDVTDIDGFDEQHLLGWGLDTNMCRRLFLKHGKTTTLEGKMAGWHCSHTRAVAATHSNRRVNSMEEMYFEVLRPDIPAQHDDWGLPNEQIEEIRLHPLENHPVLQTLNKIVPTGRTEPYRFSFAAGDTKACPPEHLAPYIADLLFSFPRHVSACYLGCDDAIFKTFRTVWQAMGFTGKILIPSSRYAVLRAEDKNGVEAVAFERFEILQRVAMVVADIHPFYDAVIEREIIEDNRRTMAILEHVLEAEQQRLAGKGQVPVKFVVLNGCQGIVAQLLQRYTNMQASPFTTRIRHGYVIPPKKDAKTAAPEQKRTGT